MTGDAPPPGLPDVLPPRVEIHPGAFLLPGFLDHAAQRAVADLVLRIAAGPAGFYRPRVRGGGLMHCEMLCLGRHWNAMTYRYEPTRADADGRPAPPLPAALAVVAERAAASVGFRMRPDVCLVNRYDRDGRMGLHQDKDEHPSTLAAGVPIVSLSLGAAARFLVGGVRRRDPRISLMLSSGDAFVMGGPSRLRYHGIVHVIGGSEPAGLPVAGRLSLTFRQYQ